MKKIDISHVFLIVLLVLSVSWTYLSIKNYLNVENDVKTKQTKLFEIPTLI